MQNFFQDSLAEVRGRVVLGVVVRVREGERDNLFIRQSGRREKYDTSACLSVIRQSYIRASV